MKPRLLDLFAGAGGAACGYMRAGFYVVGVDHRPQLNYCGDEFVQDDALALLSTWIPSCRGWWDVPPFDAWIASPPCQAYSHAGLFSNRRRADNPRLIGEVRELLGATGLPYVIENVEDARAELRHPVTICGTSLGLDVKRHRLFESTVPLLVPSCACGYWIEAKHPGTPRADGSRPLSRFVNQMASETTHEMLADAMGIDWLPEPGRKRPTNELCEAIPPSYTELVGHQLMQTIKQAEASRIEDAHRG